REYHAIADERGLAVAWERLPGLQEHAKNRARVDCLRANGGCHRDRECDRERNGAPNRTTSHRRKTTCGKPVEETWIGCARPVMQNIFPRAIAGFPCVRSIA